MKPVTTFYTLACSSKDYAECHTLAVAESAESNDKCFSFPTVMAKRDGELIGFFGTVRDDHAVIAGPLVIKGGRNGFTTMRLMEAYDNVMRSIGIKLYYFYVKDERADTLSEKRLSLIGMQLMERKEGLAWFRKEL